MRTVIKNGCVLRSEGVVRADVAFEQDHITEIGENLPVNGATVIDAENLLVMPGGVDAHTHVALTNGDVSVSDGFYAGTLAAAHGGTTTIVEHISDGPDGCSLFHMLNKFRSMAEGEVVTDYALHAVLQHVNDDIIAEVPKVILEGYPTFKAYMTYDSRLEDDAILAIMEAIQKHKGLLTVHAENHAIIQFLTQRLRESGCITPPAHPRSRPDYCEGEAVERLIDLSRAARAALYIVHLSTAMGLAHIELAQADGLPIWTETCPQYLVLDDTCYDRKGPDGDDGLKFVMAPPLRTPQDAATLWDGLRRGSIATVATDHCSFTLAKKREGYAQKGVFGAAGGIPGIETRVPLVYSEGVRTGRISLERFVDIVSTAPARLMGLTRKGVLAPGFDADIVLFNPNIQKTISTSTLHQQTDFTPFEGLTVHGWPTRVWLRGNEIIRDDRFLATKGIGEFQRREL